ncbi:MAG TPA: transglutaminase domain-containing protein [Candidatus Brocadiia bacterium]|nr:transglutaminase domain-containing protein [Candidatus Brocadiia bacterium]
MLVREGRPTINYLDSYRAHYGGREDVVIRRLEPVEDEAGVLRIELACHRPDFRHFLLSYNGCPAFPSLNNLLMARFGPARAWKGAARPVYEDGPGATTYEIAITYKTAEEYAAEGEPAPARYMVKITPPLEMEARTPESWVVLAPDAEDRRFAQETWGSWVAGAPSDYDKAKGLAKAICHDLWPRSGEPIPEMRYYSPFQMYRAMMEGKSKGFCVQFNMIFVHACKCFGVVARNMHVERPVRYGAPASVLLNGMHCAAEAYDRAMDRWIFMDTRFYCLGAYLGEEGPLTLGEFHLFMSQPYWRERLRFQIYDMETKTEKRLPMSDCPRTNIDFYSGWNTVFHVGYE